jgi:hypothetical protein
MFKKSLIAGSVTLVLLVLFALAGCSNPTDGSAGAPGSPAPLTLEATISADDLAQHFTNNDVIRLISGATVTGTVGRGKTLEIAGTVTIDTGGLLIDGGTVNILEDGVLDATTNSIDPASSGGALHIDGDLVLTYAVAKDMFAEGRPAGVSFGPNGAIDLGTDGLDANVAYLFSKGVTGVVSSAINRIGGTAPEITHWVGGNRLILSDPVATDYDVDFTGKGILVIRNVLTMDKDTSQYQHTLRSSGGGGLIIAKTGTLALNESVLPTNIPITVKGILTTNNGIVTGTIPANVDLSAATLEAAYGVTPPVTATFTFGPRPVAINKINLTENPMVIAGESNGSQTSIVNLTVKTLTNGASAPVSLTLPAGEAVVERLVTTSNTNVINIGGSRHTTLRPLSISGPGQVSLVSTDMVLSGDIEITTGTTLGLASNKNLGSGNSAQLAQLSRIIGGKVDAGALHFDLNQEGPYYTSLTTDGDLKVSGTVKFPAPNAVISANSIYAEDGPAVIEGKSNIVVAGNLIASDTITLNTSGTLTLAAASTLKTTIADGKSIIVGANSSIVVGANLVLDPGVYTATGLVTIVPSTGIISTDDLAATGLTIAPALDDAVNVITLLADGATGATFTALAGTNTDNPAVVFSGKGILIPSDSATGAKLTVSGGAGTAGVVTVKGTSTITLKAHTSHPGALDLTDGAKLGAGDTPPYVANNDDYDPVAVFDTLGNLEADGTGGSSVIITPNSTTVDGVFTSTTAW